MSEFAPGRRVRPVDEDVVGIILEILDDKQAKVAWEDELTSVVLIDNLVLIE